jgi:hypothetical protein
MRVELTMVAYSLYLLHDSSTEQTVLSLYICSALSSILPCVSCTAHMELLFKLDLAHTNTQDVTRSRISYYQRSLRNLCGVQGLGHLTTILCTSVFTIYQSVFVGGTNERQPGKGDF